MMSLVAPAMLWFGALAAVPLIVHLYHRRKRIVAMFSTNRFFTASVIQSQRRMQLQRVLLMLLRIGICFAIALALARPFLRASGIVGLTGSRDVVILLDDSLSMRAVTRKSGLDASGEANFAKAKAVAVSVLGRLSGRDRAAVFTYSGRSFGLPGAGGVGPVSNPAGLIHDIESLEASFGAGDAFWAVQQAVRVLDTPEQRARMLLLITDLQDGQWPQSMWPQPATPLPATVAQVGEPVGNNAWIEYARLGEPVMLAGQPNALEVCVRNGAPEARQIELTVRVDGKPYERRTIRVDGRGMRIEQVPMRVGPDKEGGDEARPRIALKQRDSYHEIEAAIAAPDDSLAEDNRFCTVAQSIDRLPVLLVDGQAGKAVRNRGAFYLSTALASVSDEAGIQLQRTPVDEAPWSDLSPFRALILSGVAALRPEQVESLKRFVRNGGGLIIFMGEGLDTDFYGETLGQPEADCIFPGRVKDLVVRQGELEPMTVREAAWDHEILRRFQGELRAGLVGIRIRRLYNVDPSRASTLMRVDQRMPLLLEKRYGQGTVLVFTTAPEPEWSDFPLRRNFIVLLNRMAVYAAVGVGETKVHEVGREVVLERSAREDVTARRIVRPDGKTVDSGRRAMGSDALVVISAEQADVPGFYRADAVRGSVRGAHSAAWAGAVNCPRSESVPRAVDLDAAKRFAGKWTLDCVKLVDVPAADIVKNDRIAGELIARGKTSRGLWDSLLWLALLALIAEPLIANRLSGGAASRAPEGREGGPAK